VGYNGRKTVLVPDMTEKTFCLLGCNRRKFAKHPEIFSAVYPTLEENFFHCLSHQ
jgi:hypothetical protein